MAEQAKLAVTLDSMAANWLDWDGGDEGEGIERTAEGGAAWHAYK